ncbi:lactate utilization protein C [Helicobacter aurati]|uniref:Lactate utilization protein C n=1 Tax=Helicobacter aurati TaxID=137778 RepID=A0A3D8J692_9HELI|nr:lactate utilization protein C [Helicobacter aurati]RDU72942.1 lactate utilization protein C [Helicobacter aurati]
MSREKILQALRQAQSHNPISQPNPQYFDSMIYDKEDLVNVYLQYQKANMANIFLSTKETLIDTINHILHTQNIQEILCARNILDVKTDSGTIIDSMEARALIYQDSIDHTRDKLFEIQTSILHAQVAVANLGILGLATGADNPRLASLIVATCIILLRKEDIVANLFEAFTKLRVAGEQQTLPTNIVFLAGPSRTADIELQTVFGVHGPQNIFIILYE